MNNALAKIPGVELKVLTTDSAGPRPTDRLTEEEKHTPFPYDVIFTRRIAGANVSADFLRRLTSLIHWADVIHLTATYSFPTIPTLALCRMVGKPMVWSLRGALLDDLNRNEYDHQGYQKRMAKKFWNGICRRLISSRRIKLHVTTTQERDAVAKIYPGGVFAVVPNGVTVPQKLPTKEAWLPDGCLRLMFMGRLAPKKGIENLLRAVAKLSMPVSLDIYGTATEGQGGENYGDGLVSLAQELGILGKKVNFRGLVNGEAKTRAFTGADVCVVPSYSENFCIVVAEALAHGVPVIVSNRLAWEKVEDFGCGLVVPNDPDALASAIKKIKGMNLMSMGQRGRQWMLEGFGWQKIGKDMCVVYEEMLRRVNHES